MELDTRDSCGAGHESLPVASGIDYAAEKSSWIRLILLGSGFKRPRTGVLR